MNKTNLKIVISGYYGHDNFGDEAILRAIIQDLNLVFDSPIITVLSNNPDKTKTSCNTDSVHKYNFPEIFKKINDCDVFISGGGSLFQDVTSLKSLFYYLSLLYFAASLNKKTMVYAQGIGPVNSPLGKTLTAFILKRTDLITVRDTESFELLESMGISSTVVADPVWAISPESIANQNKNGTNLGIQLREWSTLDNSKLNILADVIKSNFEGTNTIINLLPLHSSKDDKILKEFGRIMGEKTQDMQIRLLSDLTPEQIIYQISNMDFLIAMRYHACLVSAKSCVPFLAITYDPKVKNIAKSADIPYISPENINYNLLDKAVKYLLSHKDRIKSSLKELSEQKSKQIEENRELLRELL